ncbi:hypothetical protein SLEP1_g30005 [Rubroshorea leprosula]|uniref:Pre-mRNA-processing protein 40A-like n=1 Tax=Rubroshorea leprosula TaxID=152421 RepID=A0AAV5K533_9ROSI|nr:hypothetical protein SLEP1_g30005 [Rubroshorea leprosula]
MANNPQFSGVQPPPPPIVGSMDPIRNFAPPMPVQFRPVVPAQQLQQFVPVAPQPFQHVSQGVTAMGTGFPPQTQQPQFTPLMQQLPVRPVQPGHVPAAPQSIPLPPVQPNMHVTSGALRPQPNAQTPNNYTPGVGVPGSHPSSSYTFAPSCYGQVPVSVNAAPQYQPVTVSQMHATSIPAGGQMTVSVSQSNVSSTPLLQTSEQPSVTTSSVPAASIQPRSTEEASTDWIEHTSANGRRYYYNKRTRQSSWEKPWVLMTPIERADASTNWKEFTSPDGRKYYHNKVTSQSTWSIPEELKLAREQVEKASAKATQSEMFSYISTSVPPVVKVPAGGDTSSATVHGAESSPVPVVPVAATSNVEPKAVSGSSTSPIGSSTIVANTDGVQKIADTVVSPNATSDSVGVSVAIVNSAVAPMDNSSNAPVLDVLSSTDGVSSQNAEEKAKDVVVGEKVNSPLEEKATDQEPVTYANKQDAKNSFKALLESANVGSDWTWDQALRVIINDKRYGALRTLGERKQAFNEFLTQKKKQEVEERRTKQKKAREEYKKMLEDSTELTSSTRWSKAQTMFEDDERFKAVEREKDRKDLFENYIEELRQKEWAKAQEERKRNIVEYRQFLESCDFIKASSQWRKVQDLLESDERCSRLEKLDRVEIFQEYIRDLEKEEEERRKIQKEELRKAERKNRDEFRKLMDGDVASGTLNAKTHWRDYCTMVKDLPAFMAVASNTSGSTPKDLFEDVAEELQKQYHEDKVRVKDAVKLRKVSFSSTWTPEDLKAAILEDVSSPPISDVNFKLIFDELLERAREKEEKEAKKRKRLADDFSNLLHSIKELNSSSTWENCKHLFESSQEFSSIGDEIFCREIFDEYIMQLKEEAKENERRRKEEKAKKEKDREDRERRKAKHGRGKENGHEREKDEHNKDGGNDDMVEIDTSNENKRSGKDDDRKHRKRHKSSVDDFNESEKDRTRHSHRHSSDRKKSKRHASTPESDSETRHKRHRREHRNGSRRSGDQVELEDGEFGEERESR